ncbi:MAG: TIGR04076 family protein [Bacteroidales bacterium]|jgi:uncharacterized repeat protein (TIGR04076 family)|nr:TIGR04076 family protein [Bacteroidales bacterium]
MKAANKRAINHNIDKESFSKGCVGDNSRRKFIRASALFGTSTLLGTNILLGASAKNLTITKGNNSGMDNKGTTKTHKCKITVLKREYNQELADKYLANPNVGKCPYFLEGQEFIVDNEAHFRMMNGKFCGEAWDAISRYIYTALQGGSIMRGWTNDEKMMITCCNDGVRPVIFKLERIDE